MVSSITLSNISGIPYQYITNTPTNTTASTGGSSAGTSTGIRSANDQLECLFVGYNDSTIRYWNIGKTPIKVYKIYKGHTSAVSSLLCYNHRLYSGSENGEIKSIFFIFIYN